MNQNLFLSYKSLRQLIGIFGMLLSVVCVLGGLIFSGPPVQDSISFYYHTNMRDAFVGLMAIVAIFMATYRGYELIDRIVSAILSISAICIAWFPCRFSSQVLDPVGIFQINPAISNIVHSTSAIIFFSLLAFNSLFLFTKTGGDPTIYKLKRNRVYRVCGIVIAAAILVTMVLLLTLTPEQQFSSKTILISETVMLLAFGISWLVKGEAIFADPKA